MAEPDRKRWVERTPGRRRRDRLRFAPGENFYRDIILVVVCVFVYISVSNSSDAVHQQREGRRFAVGVICGATSAVITAGRGVITGTTTGPRETVFERNLEKLGYPPRHVRRAEAEKAAAAYARTIAMGVQATSGAKGRGVVRPDGSLNCDRLVVLSRAK